MEINLLISPATEFSTAFESRPPHGFFASIELKVSNTEPGQMGFKTTEFSTSAMPEGDLAAFIQKAIDASTKGKPIKAKLVIED